MAAAEQIVSVLPELKPDDPLRAAVEGSGLDAGDPLARVRRGLKERTLVLGVPRQVDGHWFAPYQEIPALPPGYDPEGAVLPREGESLNQGGVVVDLVPIDFVWFPLSEAGAHTYRHSIGALRGEGWRFVPRDTQHFPWPSVFEAKLGEPLRPAEVGPLYGVAAARRARSDYNTVQLLLVRSSM